MNIYDVLIAGGGPGGYTAALYAARAGLSVLVLERLAAGGQMAQTHIIDNYPGFAQGVDGFALAQQMQQQAERFGAETKYLQVRELKLANPIKEVITDAGTFYGKTVVIATGAGPRALGLAEEKELIGRGVGYCAACDGMFYRGKTVVVVGGGNSAAADALLLSRLAQKVILVHRRDQLRATKIYQNALLEAPNVEIRWNSVVSEILHNERVTGVALQDVNTGKTLEIPCDGVFISVGRTPETSLVKGQVPLSDAGYILADETTQTALPGVYAVGDVRVKELRQVVTAVADGAVAAHMAEQYIINN